MADKGRTPASADAGFILSLPPPENPFLADTYFQRVLAAYLPKDTLAELTPALTKFGDDAISPQVREWNLNAERQQPFVERHNVWGARHPVDRLVTSEGWKALRKWGAEEGAVAIGYETQYGIYNRIVQHAKNYLFSPVSGLTSCPLSMTDGAARLLRSQLPGLPTSHPFHETYRRLTARTDSWTSGQWMTERPGGSDVQNTETWARHAPLPGGSCGRLDEGDYLVSGFKFFSSATDADVALLLAKTEDGGKLSAFLAPLTRTDAADSGGARVTNGVRVHRLKSKLGTKQLPTAELELRDVRAHMVGPMRRGLAVARRFAAGRTVFGYPLWALPLHLRTLADVEVRIRGFAQLAFFTIALMSFTEDGCFPEEAALPLPEAGAEAAVVLRALTAAAKAVTGKNAAVTMQEVMEALGGVGYVDDPDDPDSVARALRDVSVNAIWEGTTNVLSSELVRHLLAGDHLARVHAWLSRAIAGVDDADRRAALRTAWGNLHGRLRAGRDRVDVVLSVGRGVMFSFSWIVVGVLLAWDAQRDGDELAGEVARRCVLNGEGGLREWLLPDVGVPAATARFEEGTERARWDCRLVWGKELPDDLVTFGQRTPPLGSKM
ncbi:Acyl-CoA dehydrogenase/oxidase [Cordyceps fumosorosea ARSEF 2679]|uniref:Acyl-CoA dehydrogenase/oxidase n=1 Tax=Cordyceps fumosorosea (strain ARSEF 2679) TaxID=1081104 RepID=A0A162M9Y8_CORFA|nr:Acyl-CoA dehydrogenase/oxidase [Cordyceps fumosorosea ARSEF 2679]OAA53140.1 Acyl-CoA dehydrogenase/oxidase [Cordyceps fumosorosea ARSEF 2679]